MDKPWYKQATVIGALIFALIGEAQKQGVVPAGAFESLSGLAQAAAAVYAVFGARRAVVNAVANK